MSNTRSASLCTFTFADGRCCRTPRQSGHPSLCCFHARKEAQAQAAEEIGRDVSYFLSGDFLSACDLSIALGRVFAGAARGHLKPKTAGTLAYLGQTLLQTIQLAQNEYINAYSTDHWRKVIYTHVKENGNYLCPPPAPTPAPILAQTAEPLPAQASTQTPDPAEAQTQSQNQGQDQVKDHALNPQPSEGESSPRPAA